MDSPTLAGMERHHHTLCLNHAMTMSKSRPKHGTTRYRKTDFQQWEAFCVEAVQFSAASTMVSKPSHL